MVKIKVIEKEMEIEGTIIRGRVTPFGTSSHISFGKKHRGKIVNIVVSDTPKYIWLIPKAERNELLKLAEIQIRKEKGILQHHNLNLIGRLQKEEFDLISLEKLLEFVHDKKIVSKIKSLYDLTS